MTDGAKLILSFMQERKAEKDNCFYSVDLLQTGLPLDALDRYLVELVRKNLIDVDNTYRQTVYSLL